MQERINGKYKWKFSWFYLIFLWFQLFFALLKLLDFWLKMISNFHWVYQVSIEFWHYYRNLLEKWQHHTVQKTEILICEWVILVSQIEVEWYLFEFQLSFLLIFNFKLFIKPIIPFQILIQRFSARSKICSMHYHLQ